MKIKQIIIILSVLILICSGIFYWNYSQREYIGGNVLNIALIDDVSAQKGYIPSVWKNSGFMVGLMYRTLFIADSTFERFQGNLAYSYEVLSGGLTYRIILKKGMQWSDGTAITPADVKASIEGVLQGNDVNSLYVAAFRKINSIDIEGDTITIRLNEKHHIFLPVLSQFVILPKHVLEKANLANFNQDVYWADPIVSGMYKVGEFLPNKYFKLVRNEMYNGFKPQIDEIYMHFAFNTVKLDYFSTNSVADMVSFRAMRGMEEYDVPMRFYRYFIFNMEGDDGNVNEPMCDIRVRQALAYAIDKEELLYNIYFKVGQVIDSGDVNHISPSQQAYAYNPEKAKQLLLEAGYDFDRPIRIAYYYLDDMSIYFIRQIGKYLNAIGLKVESFRAIRGGIDLYEKREYDIALKGLAAFNLGEWYSEYISTHPTMPHLFGGKGEFDPLTLELFRESNTQKRTEIIKQLVALEQEKLYKLPLFRLDQAVYINKYRVKVPDAISFGNTWYLYDIDFEDWEIRKE